MIIISDHKYTAALICGIAKSVACHLQLVLCFARAGHILCDQLWFHGPLCCTDLISCKLQKHSTLFSDKLWYQNQFLPCQLSILYRYDHNTNPIKSFRGTSQVCLPVTSILMWSWCIHIAIKYRALDNVSVCNMIQTAAIPYSTYTQLDINPTGEQDMHFDPGEI